MNTVLKYPGSKWRIAPEIVEMMPNHHTYLEPYFGSGAVFFNKKPSEIEMINDLDNDVVNLFKCIQEDSEKLARALMTTPYSRKLYDDCFQDGVSKMINEGPYRKACLFLIKCWQGYGFRTNGYKVGWKNDVQGRESMYALWNWYRLPGWIIEIAERLRTTQIENRPAIEVINRFNYKNVFMYIDPPYPLNTRSTKQYKHEMTDADHEELLKTILKSKAKIMISSYDNELYNEYLNGWDKVYFESNAEFGLRRKEVIWMNFEAAYQQLSLSDII